jgi:hypothetical protein
MSAYDRDDADWVDDKALEAARMESQVFGTGPNGEGETKPATLRRLFDENSTGAAMTIINLSKAASSERIRLDASKYIVERVLGPLGSAGNEGAPGSLEHTLDQIAKGISGP